MKHTEMPLLISLLVISSLVNFIVIAISFYIFIVD